MERIKVVTLLDDGVSPKIRASLMRTDEHVRELLDSAVKDGVPMGLLVGMLQAYLFMYTKEMLDE